MDIESELCKKADFSLLISKRISTINKDLAPVTSILKLSADSSVINENLFDSMNREDLVKLAVKMVTQLNDVKVLLKDCRTVLEDIDVTTPLDPAPQISSSQISELQSALNDFNANKPEPLDYRKIGKALEKPVKDAFKALPAQKRSVNSVNSQEQAREIADISARSCNIMIYNCVMDDKDLTAKEAAGFYFRGCGVRVIENEHESIVDAQFVNMADDKRTCTLRVKMISPLVVSTILKNCKLLKEVNHVYHPDYDTTVSVDYKFAESFITKDRTVAEQEERKKLVVELKQKINSEPLKKWIIKFGKVIAVGDFTKSKS